MADRNGTGSPSEILNGLRAARRLPAPAVARAIREAAEVTQSEMAQVLHVHRLTVRRWETGVYKPRGEAALKYARLLTELQEASK